MPSVGRHRTKSASWLPKRCYPHRRQILYRPLHGKPIPLGPIDDISACLKKYGEIIGEKRAAPRTVSEVIDRYLTEIVPGLAERTQEDYRAYCGKLKFSLGHMLPDEVTINDLYDYHNAREAPVRANREITVLGMIYRHAIRWRAATRNPVTDFLYAEETPRDRLVTGRERRLFAKRHCPPWLRGYLLLKYLCGRRQVEMLRLSTFSEKPDGIAFQIAKKRKLRTITVQWSPRLRVVWEWLKRLSRPEKCAFIFWSRRGKTRGDALSASGFKSAWKRAQTAWIEAGNTAFWEHDIRGASGSDAKSDAEAQELLDHESVTTTRKSYRRDLTKKVRPLR
jgi:hypothetical protein